MDATPFLFRFARPLPEISCPPLRYDSRRQISQAFVDGRWIDAPDADVEIMRGTIHTATVHETTDDK
jgi:hypothetical protein